MPDDLASEDPAIGDHQTLFATGLSTSETSVTHPYCSQVGVPLLCARDAAWRHHEQCPLSN